MIGHPQFLRSSTTPIWYTCSMKILQGESGCNHRADHDDPDGGRQRSLAQDLLHEVHRRVSQRLLLHGLRGSHRNVYCLLYTGATKDFRQEGGGGGVWFHTWPYYAHDFELGVISIVITGNTCCWNSSILQILVGWLSIPHPKVPNDYYQLWLWGMSSNFNMSSNSNMSSNENMSSNSNMSSNFDMSSYSNISSYSYCPIIPICPVIPICSVIPISLVNPICPAIPICTVCNSNKGCPKTQMVVIFS